MKKVEVTSCSHSHGAPMVRVTMSQTTEVLKQINVAPHSIISTDSSQSSARHFSRRCFCSTSERSSAIRFSDARRRPYFTAPISCWTFAAWGPRSLAIFSR